MHLTTHTAYSEINIGQDADGYPWTVRILRRDGTPAGADLGGHAESREAALDEALEARAIVAPDYLRAETKEDK